MAFIVLIFISVDMLRENEILVFWKTVIIRYKSVCIYFKVALDPFTFTHWIYCKFFIFSFNLFAHIIFVSQRKSGCTSGRIAPPPYLDDRIKKHCKIDIQIFTYVQFMNKTGWRIVEFLHNPLMLSPSWPFLEIHNFAQLGALSVMIVIEQLTTANSYLSDLCRYWPFSTNLKDTFSLVLQR